MTRAFDEILTANRFNGPPPAEDVAAKRGALADLPPDERTPVFRRQSLAELLARPPKQWLVDQIFGARDIGMIYGDSGAGKTFVVIDAIFACLTGRPWAGRFNVTKPLTVAYATDEGVSGLPGRFAAACQAWHVTPESIENFHFFEAVPQLFDADSEFNTQAFVDDFKLFVADSVDLLFVDTYANASVGAKENSNEDATTIARRIKTINEALGCCTWLVHHAGKHTGDLRGATAIKGHCDFVLKLEAKANGAARLTHDKARHCAPFEPLMAHRVMITGQNDPIIEWRDDDSDGADNRQKDKILAALLEYPDQRFTKNDVAELVPDVSDKMLMKLLKQLVETDETIQRDLLKPDQPKSRWNPFTYYIGNPNLSVTSKSSNGR